MAAKHEAKARFSLGYLLELAGLPARFQLIKEGLNPSAELYRQVAQRVLRAYFNQFGLDLQEVEHEVYEVVLAPGAQWRDVAYALGHWANLKAGRVVVHSPDDLLRREPLTGEPRHFEELREAVLANLNLLKSEPASEEDNLPARALRAALEAAEEVEKVRRVA